jgi:hypothetical protein
LPLNVERFDDPYSLNHNSGVYKAADNEQNSNFKVFWKELLGLDVYIVNEEYVEDNIENTFYGGGHYYAVYNDGPRVVKYSDFMKENEVWINKPDMALFVHEYIERLLMSKYGMKYEAAHYIAGLIEAIWRHKFQVDKKTENDIQ